MSTKDKTVVSQQELDNLLEVMNKRFQTVEERMQLLSSSLKGEESLKGGGDDAMPQYKCLHGNCRFATDDLDAYLDHRDEHKTKEKPIEEETPPTPKKRHETAKEWLSCPECSPAFEKAIVELGIPEKLGYVKKEVQKKRESRGELTL